MNQRFIIIGVGSWVLFSMAIAAVIFFISNAYGLGLAALIAKLYLMAIGAGFLALLLLPLIAFLILLMLAIMIVLLLAVILLPIILLVAVFKALASVAGKKKPRRRTRRHAPYR